MSNATSTCTLISDRYRFRWVACQLDFICDLASDDEYCKALDGPAPSLFKIYERLLLRLQSRPKSTQDLVKSTLTWILFANDWLDIKTLCEAVAIRAGSEKKSGPAAPNQIRKFCSSLIREAADGKHLEAAHFTVKEFFNSITKDSHPHIAHFCLLKDDAYLEFSTICLTYLNFKDFHQPIPPFDELKHVFVNHPLYLHAANYWMIYAKNHWTDKNILRLAKQLFKPPMSTNFKLWRNYVIWSREDDVLMERINRLGDSPLHWAAYFCIDQLLAWLVSCGQDVDYSAALGTPLSCTVSCTYLENFPAQESIEAPPYSHYNIFDLFFCDSVAQTCIETLIQNGARTEHIYECKIDNKNYNLSLREVLLYHLDIKVLEIESFAIEFFDEQVADRMKNIIDSIEEENLGSGFDIPWREQVVRTLRRMNKTHIVPEYRPAFDDYVMELEDGIEPDYGTMEDIWLAAQNDQADVLRSLLIERGGIKINELVNFWESDVDEEDENDEYEESYRAGKNALHYAASAGSFECIQVLFDAGASVHITTECGSTAFHFAAGSSNIGAKQCLEMLVNAGISLDVKNEKGWTALHFGVFSGHPKNVEFLLDKGFDPYLADDSGQTAYHLAANNDSGDVLKILLEHEKGGISGIHVPDFKPVLRLAVVKNKAGFIGELIKYIGVDELAIAGELFLLFVARQGSVEMMQVVLSSHPDIFVRSNDQSTILHAMAENTANFGYHITRVIKRGASVSDTRNDGSIPLHLLLAGLQSPNKKLLEMMIEGNPNTVDGRGDNYLMCLSRSQRPASQKKDIAFDLIKLGVDAFQKNNYGNFFYNEITNTDLDLALKVTPHINNLKEMDGLHWGLSGWPTIHFAIINGDLNLVKALLEKGSCFWKRTKFAEFNVAGRQVFRTDLNCMHVAALHG